MNLKEKQIIVKKWFVELQNMICKRIEHLEKEYGSKKKFKINKWKHGNFRIIEGRFFYWFFKEHFSYEILRWNAKSTVDSVQAAVIEEQGTGTVQEILIRPVLQHAEYVLEG